MRDERIVFRDCPIAFWIFGTIAIVIAAMIPDVRLAFLPLGILSTGFASVLTVTFDRTRRTLHLRYWSLFRRWKRSYSRDEIGAVYVKEDNEADSFRVEMMLQSGDIIPLRLWYSPGKRRHERTVRKLQSALSA